MRPKELPENEEDESDVQKKHKHQTDDEKVFGSDFNTLLQEIPFMKFTITIHRMFASWQGASC